MYTRLIEFATPDFDIALKLRDLVLRKPLNMEFYPEDISEEYDSYHLACFDDRDYLVGILVLKPINESVLKMRQVAISPKYQGQGIGTYLVKSAESVAVCEGYSQFELHARESAVKFYKRMDYAMVGNKFEEVGLPHFKMKKKLS